MSTEINNLENQVIKYAEVSATELVLALIKAVTNDALKFIDNIGNNQNTNKGGENMSEYQLPFSVVTSNNSIIITAAENTSLKFKMPEFLGTPEEIAAKFDFSYDSSTSTVELKTKQPIQITIKDPKNFTFGESSDKESLEVGYSIPIPPFGFVHIPALLAWKPSTGTLDFKLFKSVGTNI